MLGGRCKILHNGDHMAKAAKIETFEYQTEIKKLLDIVIHSLYTNREIFVRELISNAADALEKMRHVSLTQDNYTEKDLPLEIRIEASKDLKTFTISDTGVGMTKDELIENLGTIAHSGSQEFLKQLEQTGEIPTQLIGQFGVGFYSAFMAAQKVKVITRSYKTGAKGWLWTSDGTSSFTIEQEEGISRGTRIILELKEETEEYADPESIKRIIKQYSNFVPFPIMVEDEKINTIQAIWTKTPNNVEQDEYNEFYKFIANAHSDPLFRLHLSADAPIQLNSLLFFPKENMESFGFMRLEPGVGLYCNKVLIDAEAKDLLPEYLRFIKGVVDSEDLPLNISRETLQDNKVVRKISKFLTKRIITFLQKQSEENEDQYNIFWKDFQMFIKEGAHTDYENQGEISKLLRFESSAVEAGQYQSLQKYCDGMSGDHKDIYYISGANREEIENSPYLEIFRKNNLEVLYLYDNVDDFVLTSLREFDGKKLISADQADISLPSDTEKTDNKDVKKAEKNLKKLIKDMKDVGGDRISEIKVSTRLVDSPAILVNPDQFMTTGMQKVMQATNKDFGSIGSKVLEINPQHPIITRLADLEDEDTSRLIMEQIIDNAFLAAGLKTNSQNMIRRMNEIMKKSLG